MRPSLGVLALLAWITANPSGVPRWTRAQPGVAPQQARAIVDELVLIQSMTPKRGQPQGDEHALAILALGRVAVPYLIERIVDASPSPLVYGYRHAVGDVALALLDEICDTPSWPFPDGSRVLAPPGYFGDYVELVESPGAREALQRSWENFYRTNGCPTGPWASGHLTYRQK